MRLHLKSAVAAVAVCLGLLLSAAVPARAELIFSTMPTNPGSNASTYPGNNQSLLTSIQVGAANVTINSFGTYGQLTAPGNLKWAIFSSIPGTTPLFSTSAIATSASGTRIWYDSPEFAPFTLQANTRYQLGVISDQAFTYSFDTPGTPVTQNGLTAPSLFGYTTNAGFANPQYQGASAGLILSFRAYGTNAVGATATPEPETWAMMGLGLLALGIFQWRRKRTTSQTVAIPAGAAF